MKWNKQKTLDLNYGQSHEFSYSIDKCEQVLMKIENTLERSALRHVHYQPNN